MSTLTEIEAAVEALPPQEQQELIRYLESRFVQRALPLVPASGQPITQQDIDDALESD